MVALAKNGQQRPNLQAWNVQARDYPHTGTRAEQMKFLIQYALLAANSHNTQPWKFQVYDSTIELYWDEERALPLSDPLQRQGMISLGCSLGNLVVAGEHFGFAPQIVYGSAVEHISRVAVVHMHEASSQGEHAPLFDALPTRRMNRFPYMQQPLTAESRASLLALSQSEGVMLTMVDDALGRDVLLSAVYHSTLGTQGNMQIVEEWSKWMRPRNTRHYDGIPLTEDFGFPGPLAYIAPFVWSMTPGRVQARNTRKLFATAPAFFVISGPDSQEGWLRAGQALSYLGLAATQESLAYAPWGAVVEYEPTAHLVRNLLRLEGRVLFFGRLGYAKHGPPLHTPRRPLDEVLREQEQGSVLESTKQERA